jgi:hypothetical protein
MTQDRRLEITQGRGRFQAQLFRERDPELTVGLEGFGLTPIAVEGKHELAAKSLP